MTVEVDLNAVTIPLRWSQLFGRDAPTDVEIGSGKGRFLNEWATAHPERNDDHDKRQDGQNLPTIWG